jgi:hypothetical protein
LYSRGSGFESRPGDKLISLRFLCSFLQAIQVNAETVQHNLVIRARCVLENPGKVKTALLEVKALWENEVDT